MILQVLISHPLAITSSDGELTELGLAAEMFLIEYPSMQIHQRDDRCKEMKTGYQRLMLTQSCAAGGLRQH